MIRPSDNLAPEEYAEWLQWEADLVRAEQRKARRLRWLIAAIIAAALAAGIRAGIILGG